LFPYIDGFLFLMDRIKLPTMDSPTRYMLTGSNGILLYVFCFDAPRAKEQLRVESETETGTFYVSDR
jgi:hypothetical protein